MRWQILIVTVFCLINISFCEEEGSTLSLDVIDHFPCDGSLRGNEFREKMRFPANSESKIVPNGQPGCYKFGGNVKVFSRMPAKIWMHIEMSHNSGDATKESKLEQCYDYDEKSQCGGFGGDCLHCDFCDNEERRDGREFTVQKVWMTYNNRKIDCDEGFRRALQQSNQAASQSRSQSRNPFAVTRNRGPGLELHFCLPNEEEFLKTKGIALDLWNKLVDDKKSRRSGGVPKTIAMFMTIRTLENDFTTQMRMQRTLQAAYTGRGGDEMPMSTRGSLPFNRIIWKQNRFIACHKIIGNLVLN